MNLSATDRDVLPEEDEQARVTFESVYRAYAETVARWAGRLGGPGAEIEDITQDVFLIVNRRLGDFRHESHIATWLFSITAKVAANDRRRRKVRGWWSRVVAYGQAHGQANGQDRSAILADNPIEQLERRQRRAQFYAALDELGERQRRVLVLFELENLTVAEIAELMRLRPGNVRVILHRARAAFLRKMTERELRDTLEEREPSRPQRVP